MPTVFTKILILEKQLKGIVQKFHKDFYDYLKREKIMHFEITQEAKGRTNMQRMKVGLPS
jgi:hypothetical protein